ncbi:hypothetical protein [Bowmanella yangjiangensis]|uniref:Uncharacterized protein n=1 Tax=Bowmanella yangjiangensis TaxID=2811230 RepID=A0ABS3CYL5_9ALTE|nr:hypothetical protein [Bowmanella yangjiangensis]MBN7822215.1 hypothetical protein [Bowmanella yangjiangensis]
MTDIDWSKVPEDAIGAMIAKFEHSGGYGVVEFICSENQRRGYTEGLDAWEWHARPAEWVGKGLPPTDTVCEYNAASRHADGGELWCVVQVKYRSEWVIVFECISAPSGHEGSVGVELFGDVNSSLESRFRPIRTPEQIAQERALSEIEALYSEGGPAAVYDAGYRKVTP